METCMLDQKDHVTVSPLPNETVSRADDLRKALEAVGMRRDKIDAILAEVERASA